MQLRALCVGLMAMACAGETTWGYSPTPGACDGLAVRVERIDGVPGASIVVYEAAQDGGAFDPSGLRVSFPANGLVEVTHAMTSASGELLSPVVLTWDGAIETAALPNDIEPAEALTLGFADALDGLTAEQVALSGCRQ